MKKLLLSSMLALTLSSTAQASDWELLPVLNPDHQLEPSLAIILGGMKMDKTDAKSELLYGLELGVNCPLLKVPGGKIRQQIQITKFDDNNLKVTQLNLNPHYEVYSSNTLAIGVGPSFGAAKVETATEDDTVFTYGFGANIRTDVTDELFFGLNVGYEASTDATLAGVSDNINNLKYFIKMGYQF